MGHKWIQPLQYPKSGLPISGKTETLKNLKEYVEQNRDEFKNGEEIVVKFLDDNDTGSTLSSIALVYKSEDDASISVMLNSNETKKIVESEKEPTDDDALWLREASGTTPEEIKNDLTAIRRAISELCEIVNRHDFAFKVIMDCGDLETNSAKRDMMSAASAITPDILKDDDDTGTTETLTASDEDEYEEIEPDYPNYEVPNITSICIKGAQTEAIIRANVANINERELILCEQNYTLYTKLNGNLVKISGSSGGGGGTDTGSTEEIMSGITQSGDSISSIRFIASSGTKYIVKVDDDGNLVTYNEILDSRHAAPTTGSEGDTGITELFEQKLYINSIYCGGTDSENQGVAIDEHSLNYCSHNFVELSNLTDHDINLSGLSLQYAIKGGEWKVLPLYGMIKSGGTFLVRGAQCSVMDANTTTIKVKDYDMEWYVTENEETNLIQFSNKACKFYLTYGTSTPDAGENPYEYNATTSAVTVLWGYIDLVGLQTDTDNTIDAYESKPAQIMSSSNRIYTKYYTMDPVSQATKALDKRNNANDIQYVDLTKSDGDVIPSISVYTPKASADNKDIFFNKTKLVDDKPTVVTCSFGIQATDNGGGATRCFNWISKDLYDECYWIYDSDNTLKFSGHSVNGEAKLDESGNINPNYYYNRICQEATDGTFFTVHKAIVRNIPAGEYTYIVGRPDSTGNPDSEHCTSSRKFVVRTDTYVKANGVKFVQTSDQQGFNWEEYQMWKYTGRDIIKNSFDFLLNTGDMTQNGNRINEWIDYFDARDSYLSDFEEMATVGNNDLCPEDIYKLGDGGDASKINPANILLFYTFEIDPENLPVFDITVGSVTTSKVYVPSLYSFNYGPIHFMCINSEITINTEMNVFDISGITATNYGYTYEKVKEWCTKDLELHRGDDSGIEWTIAYCHENPFTIMIDSLKESFLLSGNTEDTSIYRGGSHLNTVATSGNTYWFSKFCQENNIRLSLCGHKHTQATTWPLKENFDGDGQVVSMKPIIQVTSSSLTEFNESTKLITISGKTQKDGHYYYLNGYSYPNKWFDDETAMTLNTTFSGDAHFCTFELVDKITAPVYAMSQSSGYKHTSNKELPAFTIPWERYFYPNAAAGSANKGQRYPFYTVWNVTFGDNAEIEGTVKKVAGLFNDGGKFNINTQGANAKKNKSNDTSWGANPVAINGITAGQDKQDKEKSESEWLKIVINK